MQAHRRNNHANRHAASGCPALRRPGVHARKISLRPLPPGTDARLAVRDQEEQVSGQRRPTGSIRRAGRPTAASRMAGRCIVQRVRSTMYTVIAQNLINYNNIV